MNKLYCGDCVEIMDKMPPDSIDLTVTSPPYDNLRTYNRYTFDFENIAKQLYRITKEGGVVVWVVGDQTKDGDESGTSFRQALYFKEIGFKLFDTMIYAKQPRGAVGNDRGYWQGFEYMFVFTKGKLKTSNLIEDRNNKMVATDDFKNMRKDGTYKRRTASYGEVGRRTNVWKYNTGSHSTQDCIAFNHPAIFPEKLAHDHIISWSNEGDVVLDPMCGSGTTCKMAYHSNRKYIGIDISPEYIAISHISHHHGRCGL